MIKKIQLSTSDTPYTLDTYATFTFDDAVEYITENMRELHPELPEISYDDIEWNYDCEGYLAALAKNWESLMRDNMLDDVILKVTVTGKPHSPREYNFSTDDAPIEIEYNEKALCEYIAAHRDQYEREKRRSYDGYMWLGDERDNEIMWYLAHNARYHTSGTNGNYTPGNYVVDQLEKIAATDYIDYTLKPLCASCNKERTRDITCYTCTKKYASERDAAMRDREDRFLLSVDMTREQFNALETKEKQRYIPMFERFA